MKKIHIRLTKIRLAGGLFGLALLMQALVPFLSSSVSAGTLTNTLVRFDRLGASQPTTGTVCAKPATTATEASVVVAFPSGFTLGAAATFTVNTSNPNSVNWPTGATAWLGINTATNVTGQNVTFPSSDLTVGTLYCFNWANTAAVTTGSAGAYSGTVTTQTSAPAAIDSGNYSTTIVTGSTDQVQVSAQVNPTFSMSLSTNSDNLNTLSTGSVSSSGTPIQAQINTNAANGWYLWGLDSNSGLNSSTASYTIQSNCSGGHGSNSTLSAGTEGYNLGATVASQGTGSGLGVTSIAATFTGGSHQGGGLCSSNYQTIATSTGVANVTEVNMTNNAAISGVTKPANDYKDTETFVGAGLF